LLITTCMGSFGLAGLSLGFAVTLLVSLTAIEPALLKQRLFRLPLMLSALLFLMWGLITLAWSESNALLPTLSDWSRWLILIPAAGFMMTDEIRHGIWRAFIAVQLLLALWSMYLGIDCFIDWTPFVQASECIDKRIPHGSMHTSWMLAFAALLALVWLEGRWRWAFALLLVFPLVLIGNLVAFFLLAMSLAVSLWFASSLKTMRVQVLLGSAAIAAAAMIVNPSLEADIDQIFRSAEHESLQTAPALQDSAAQRLALWRAASLALRDQPLIGHGIGSWSEVYRGFQAQVQGPVSSVNPQSSYLQIAVEQGLIGLCFFLGLMAALWQAAYWLTGFEAVAFRMLIVSFSVGGLFYSWTHDAGASRMFLVLMVLCLAGLRAPNHVSPKANAQPDAKAEPREKGESKDKAEPKDKAKDQGRPLREKKIKRTKS
jgi:hypothetical protein